MDNYGVLVHDPATGATAAIDAPEAEHALPAAGWPLTDILVTIIRRAHCQHRRTRATSPLPRLCKQYDEFGRVIRESNIKAE
jgi:hypothetical protein